MGAKDDNFWDLILGYIEDKRLLPVVGPELTVVRNGNVRQTFTSLIGQRLASKYDLSTSSEMRTMQEAVAAILQKHGRDQVGPLYNQINRIIKEVDQEPCDALLDLAAIDDLRLFVSTTPDRLLAKALNEVRFRGRELTRELSFSLSWATSGQAQQFELSTAPADTVVLNLFGRATSTPEYAIHEEDRLEWLHALLPDAARLPEWLAYELRHRPMLFIGCEIPDWIGRFLLRLSSTERLSDEHKQFFFVGSSNTQERSLSDFFETYCRRPMVQHLEMEPTAFVSALRARCAKHDVAAPQTARPWIPDGSRSSHGSATPSIFISYMREDLEAARRLESAITRLGGNAWLDTQRLEVGDDWEKEILTAIGETVRLFVPVISANTEREHRGYVFREWREALEQQLRVSSGHFIMPVIVDDYDGDLSRYPKGREFFKRLHFGSAPAGEPDAALTTLLSNEIDAINRPGAA